MKPKAKYRYEIGIPVRETWYYLVEADSLEDAHQRIRNGDPSATQVCSLASGKRRKPFVVKREKL
jgi:hypothetical protein